MPGNDMIHGPHQVAQKSRTTTFPRNSESFIFFPSKSTNVKSGASAPTEPALLRFTSWIKSLAKKWFLPSFSN